MDKVTKRLLLAIPFLNLIIGSTALCFQIGVLYPWHLVIDESHEKLHRRFEEHEKVVILRMDELDDIGKGKKKD